MSDLKRDASRRAAMDSTVYRRRVNDIVDDVDGGPFPLSSSETLSSPKALCSSWAAARSLLLVTQPLGLKTRKGEDVYSVRFCSTSTEAAGGLLADEFNLARASALDRDTSYSERANDRHEEMACNF